jgi:UDP-N-acetyl-D-galactosamine dehydrogenase
MHEYGITVVNQLPIEKYSAAILAVSHKEFANLDIRAIVNNGVVFDVKGVLTKDQVDARL